MKDKPFYYLDNRALHEKRLKERTRVEVTRQNIAFILAHQHDTREELAAYLRRCKKELGHVPAQAEVLGGDLLELRFGSWAGALNYSGFVNFPKYALQPISLENTSLFRAEYDRRAALRVQAKKDRKKQAKADRRERKSEKKQTKAMAAVGGSE